MMPTHRKILEESQYPSNSTIICTSDCDPSKPPSINCFPTCILNTTDPSPPPSPPLSPPYTDGYIFNTPPSHHHSSLSLPLKISIVILILTFSFFLLYTLYKFYTVWYRSRRRRAPPPSPSRENQETSNEFLDHDVLDHPIWYIRTIGLQPSVISAITVVKYSKTDGLIEGVSCSVCLNDFQEDETLRLLPKCNHAFHVACIDTWLRSHTSCPLCRAGIVKSVSNNNNNNIININNNNDNLDEVEESVTVLVTEDGDGEQREEDEQMTDVGIVGGSGFIRRSVSLNDYEACRVRSDVRINVNNYYSDRHDVQIQPVDGSLGFDLVKVDRTANNCP